MLSTLLLSTLLLAVGDCWADVESCAHGELSTHGEGSGVEFTSFYFLCLCGGWGIHILESFLERVLERVVNSERDTILIDERVWWGWGWGWGWGWRVVMSQGKQHQEGCWWLNMLGVWDSFSRVDRRWEEVWGTSTTKWGDFWMVMMVSAAASQVVEVGAVAERLEV